MKQRIVLFNVDSNQKKIHFLCETVKMHFEKKEPLLLFVSDDKGLTYVDELLWKVPEESFIPHIISAKETEEKIVITKLRENLNQAKYVFNLCPTPILQTKFTIIYDFDDKTSPHKRMLSQKRFEAYKNAKWVIESR